MTTARKPRSAGGFTLLELLIVIGIIVILISILLPVASTVRVRAQVTQTRAQMATLQQAIMNYYHDWNAYPGPLANDQLVYGRRASQTGVAGLANVTSSENLALGLLGYLDAHYNPAGPPTLSVAPQGSTSPQAGTFPPRPPNHDVLNLNPLQPKTYHYIDFVASQVSNGRWLDPTIYSVPPPTDSTGQNNQLSDTSVPEFLDSINVGIGPMPILYIRANPGINTTPARQGIDYDARQSANTPLGQYDISQFAPYGFLTVSTTDYPAAQQTLPSATPWTWYLANPNIYGTPRGKDGFLLISAGADRQFGTADDIIVTP